MITIYADDLQPGDVVDYHGHPHHVAYIDRRDGWAWPVAFDGAGWAIALGHELVVIHCQGPVLDRNASGMNTRSIATPADVVP